MEKLKNKTFYTIFLIISLFLLVAAITINIQNYQKEYNGIKNNLTRMNRIFFNEPNRKPLNKNSMYKDLNDKIIMDYNIYTFILDKNNNITHQISHNENNLNYKITEQAKKILNNKISEIKINSLYIRDISYNLKVGAHLIIIDTTNIRSRLLALLISTFIILIFSEIIVYFVAKQITKWITEPVEETFNKQKNFIADASHELKTPLAVIMASTDCLEKNKKNEKYIDNIKSESDRMNNLIIKLLDLSKSEQEIEKELYSSNNLSKIVEKGALVFESLAYENDIKIKTDIEKDIMLNSNETAIDEVVSILIDNAIKHSYKDSTIKLKLYKEKNKIILDVINNGKVIPKEECDKIFERFYRADKSRNRDSNRYGLGLAIAKNIVTKHNGEIKAISKENITIFRIIFK